MKREDFTSPGLFEIALLGQVGALIWGENWRTSMSIFLEIRRDTIQDWLQSRNPIPRFVWPRLFAELERQVEKIAGARAEMQAAGLLKRKNV